MIVVNVQLITMRHVLKTESVALNLEVYMQGPVNFYKWFRQLQAARCTALVSHVQNYTWCVKISQKQFNIFESLGRHDSVNDQRQWDRFWKL